MSSRSLLGAADIREVRTLVPCIVIPTFWCRSRERVRGRLRAVYDHPTPLDGEGTLAACLASFEHLDRLGKVVVVAAATDPAIEHAAEDRVQGIVSEFPGLDALVFGQAELGSLHRRLEQLEFADMIEGVSLTGYGAVRNLGLMVAAVLGCETVLFVDDDEVVNDESFLDRALEGLGSRTEDDRLILAKSGFYVDQEGRHQTLEEPRWTDAFWRIADAYNQTLSIVDAPPRLKPSPVAFGGCLVLERDMYCNVSFDPWVVRGEDVDYVINARMHGGDVFLDGEWSIRHHPPQAPSAAIALRQDVYRFIYEHRKLEFAKSQVDLRPVTPESLEPFPGLFLGSSVLWRAAVTALMHSVVGGAERDTYIKVFRAAIKDASRYARENCDKYFAFQRRWPLMMDRIWEDVPLKTLFSGERRVDRTAISGRFPVIRPQ